MSDYQLEIKQIVDYPRCRVYREFVQSLISDRNIRTNGSSGLFHYTVLCSYANFRTSYICSGVLQPAARQSHHPQAGFRNEGPSGGCPVQGHLR